MYRTHWHSPPFCSCVVKETYIKILSVVIKFSKISFSLIRGSIPVITLNLIGLRFSYHEMLLIYFIFFFNNYNIRDSKVFKEFMKGNHIFPLLTSSNFTKLEIKDFCLLFSNLAFLIFYFTSTIGV